ncbi:MAG: c-type cytochrome [Gammaproteobacteria bacterium]|nr:c-type cytochrome [Gammaproteobacteria bacterium]
MTFSQRHIAYVINAVILFGVAGIVLTSENSHSSAETKTRVEESKHLYGPGDVKEGYDSPDYTTKTLDLQKRIGKEADLLQFVSNPPLGLPDVPVPEDNPVTKEKVSLGRKLFFDRRLSINDTFSCAICHIPEQGFTNNEIQTAVGVEGRSGKRNAPMIYNVAYLEIIFHDGRESTLEQQVWAPFLARNEMANPSIGYVINKIKAIPEYKGLFEQAFHGRGPTMETVGMALSAYQRTLNSADSPFDRWHFGKQEDAVSEQVKRGYELFNGKATCNACHLIHDDYALFTDNQLHNTGLGYLASMGVTTKTTRVQLAPGVYADLDNEVIKSVSRPKENDVGRYEVTQNPNDRWKFRTPTLRNVALTAPYMHDGSLHTLRQVMEFYNQGGVPNEVLSPLIKPLGLTDQEMDDVVAFMMSLTGSNVGTLVADAFAAPIGDISKDDPNWAHEKNIK